LQLAEPCLHHVLQNASNISTRSTREGTTRTFQELLHERPRRALLGLKEKAEKLIRHLPLVHGLLELLLALMEEHVDGARVGRVPVLLELGPQSPADELRAHIQSV
jgi:hypothetical protein